MMMVIITTMTKMSQTYHLVLILTHYQQSLIRLIWSDEFDQIDQIRINLSSSYLLWSPSNCSTGSSSIAPTAASMLLLTARCIMIMIIMIIMITFIIIIIIMIISIINSSMMMILFRASSSTFSSRGVPQRQESQFSMLPCSTFLTDR